MIDDCWRRAREVAARVLTNDMLKKRIMRDGRGEVGEERRRDGVGEIVQ